MKALSRNAARLCQPSSSGDEGNEKTNAAAETKKNRDVWYRYYLKLLFLRHDGSTPMLSYKENFRRRTPQPVGIPATPQLGTVHQAFRTHFEHYSPLWGMMFTYNHFIPNVFRYGDEAEPATRLVRMIFHILPGGEIQPTHAGRKAAAQLSPSIVGEVLVAFDRFITKDISPSTTTLSLQDDDKKNALYAEILHILTDHPDGQAGRQELVQQVEQAQSALQALHVREHQSQPIRQKIKMLEGDVIKASKNKIKRIRKEMEKITEAETRDVMEQDIVQLEQKMESAKQEVERLREEIVTSLHKKVARKDLKRAQDAVREEEEDRTRLTRALIESLCTYDLSPSQAEATNLFYHATTAILSAFLWLKYDTLTALSGYFECMERIGALTVSAEKLMKTIIVEALSIEHSETTSESGSDGSVHEASLGQSSSKVSIPTKSLKRTVNSARVTINKLAVRKRPVHWDGRDLANAAVVVTTKPGVSKRPQVIPFNYVSWASYNSFPDCGETALHNLINQMIFNPDTFRFDVALLEELQESAYPNLNVKLIAFYRKHSTPSDVMDYSTSQDWIRVVSQLNSGAKDEIPIRYRREMEQTNIASPLRNLMRAFNAIFGVADRDSDAIIQIVQVINKLRPWSLTADTSDIAKDGFGTVRLSAGKVRYELHSYKPVHFGFVQEVQDSSRQNFKVFRRLLRYSQRRSNATNDLPSIALTGLFVPYILQGRRSQQSKLDGFPLSLVLYFADWQGGQTTQEANLAWAQRQRPDMKDSALQSLLRRIQDYQEPTFLPPSSRKEAE